MSSVVLSKPWNSLLGALILYAMIPISVDAGEPESKKTAAGFEVELQTIHSGYDRKTCWVHPRAGMIPGDCSGVGDPFTVVLTMHELRISDSDCYLPIHDMRTDDGGKTWTGPTSQVAAFGRHYIWRAATHDGTAYLCARRKRGYSESELGESLNEYAINHAVRKRGTHGPGFGSPA
jgi:hypothetical protein